MNPNRPIARPILQDDSPSRRLPLVETRIELFELAMLADLKPVHRDAGERPHVLRGKLIRSRRAFPHHPRTGDPLPSHLHYPT
jgi:hypothetical protein